MRAKWKGFSVSKELELKEEVIIRRRGEVIGESMIGKRIGVYNGKIYFSYIIRREMIGHKFGEFSVTKVLGGKIHENKKKVKMKVKKKGGKDKK